MKKLIALLFTFVILFSSITVVFATGSSLGDLNSNGKIDVMDATAVQRHIAKLVTLSDEEKDKSDVDGDGEITIMDCTSIQQFVAMMIDRFPAEIETDSGFEPGTMPTQKPTEPETQAPTTPVEDGTPSEYELEILRLVNIEREKEGLQPLEFGYFIYDCAKLRAKECDLNFSHIRPDGTECFTVFEELGVTERYRIVGENIAWGHVDAEDVMLGEYGWMNSPGHRANIMRPEFKYVAIGAVECTEQRGTYATVQLFWG